METIFSLTFKIQTRILNICLINACLMFKIEQSKSEYFPDLMQETHFHPLPSQDSFKTLN
jgi:hypothetical protein